MELLLVANPGSSSRKYALYQRDDLKLLAELHFELQDGRVVCTLDDGSTSRSIDPLTTTIEKAGEVVESLLLRERLLPHDMTIELIGLRVVAPGGYFMNHHIIDDDFIERLSSVEHFAPLHISATLTELKLLREAHPHATIAGISDSAFHVKKPPYAWNYGIDIHDADRLEIKRFGYHGISVSSAIDELWNRGKLPPKVIVCHLGSGSSVTGVFHGRSIDTTMGLTPNEGVIMATRSGSISADAAHALKSQLNLDDAALERYLNTQSGLLGIGGSNDIRELIEREQKGDHMAHLALTTLIHTIHKAIGSMLVAMNGCDLLVFTGTVGERSAIIRKRIVAHLEFTDFILDGDLNDACTAPEKFTSISQAAKSKPIIVIPTDEAIEIAKHTREICAS